MSKDYTAIKALRAVVQNLVDHPERQRPMTRVNYAYTVALEALEKLAPKRIRCDVIDVYDRGTIITVIVSPVESDGIRHISGDSRMMQRFLSDWEEAGRPEIWVSPDFHTLYLEPA